MLGEQVLLDHFVPVEFQRRLKGRAAYDDEEERWVLRPSPPLPAAATAVSSSPLELRPVSEFEKLGRSR